jgi:hypothetical protein
VGLLSDERQSNGDRPVTKKHHDFKFILTLLSMNSIHFYLIEAFITINQFPLSHILSFFQSLTIVSFMRVLAIYSKAVRQCMPSLQ